MKNRLVFLDFEASGLEDGSHPIELGWAFEDPTADSGIRSSAILIRPMSGWSIWSSDAERIHGIPQSLLLRDGVKPNRVVERFLAATREDCFLVSDAPAFDGAWLAMLLRAAQVSEDRVTWTLRRVISMQQAWVVAAAPLLDGSTAGQERAVEVINATLAALPSGPRVHRAEADARDNLLTWQMIRDAVLAAVPSNGTKSDMNILKEKLS